jgi:uncharacterized protein (DUF1330 family)
MSAYMIADIEVFDPERFIEYRKQVRETVEQHGGRFIVRAGPTEVLEGAWRPNRVVVIEFSDMAALKAWYHSPEYQRLVPLRQATARGSLIAVEGV